MSTTGRRRFDEGDPDVAQLRGQGPRLCSSGSRQLAARLSEEAELEAPDDRLSLLPRRVTRERPAQDREVAPMRLELEELKARDHQVRVRIRREGGKERDRLTGERLRLVQAPSR